jgi:hypothetical protein
LAYHIEKDFGWDDGFARPGARVEPVPSDSALWTVLYDKMFVLIRRGGLAFFRSIKGGSMRRILTMLVCSVWLMAGFASGQEPSVKSMPPSVVKTVPQCGNMNVDAAVTKQITVTFSKEMMDGSWSFIQISSETFPQISGKPKYLDDKKTCVVEVKLEAKKTYVIWLNFQKFTNFKDAYGNPAVPYLLVFQTR